MNPAQPLIVRVSDEARAAATACADNMDLPEDVWITGLIAETLPSKDPAYLELAESDYNDEVYDHEVVRTPAAAHELEVPERSARALVDRATKTETSVDKWVEALVWNATNDRSFGYEIVMEALAHELISVPGS